jgi:formate dehydrogenase subunit gamma
LCRAEACQSVGAEALATHVKAKLGCDFNETTADSEFTLEPVYCLGQCSCGPSIMVGDDVHARVTPEKFDGLIKAKRGQK